jgi:hypothetical protein
MLYIDEKQFFSFFFRYLKQLVAIEVKLFDFHERTVSIVRILEALLLRCLKAII